MKIERFEDIIAWQKALDLTVEIYNLFEKTNDFGFKDQIQKSFRFNNEQYRRRI